MEEETKRVYGPTIPPKPKIRECLSKKDVCDNTYGPALPPHLQQKQTVGPILPQHMREKLQNNVCDVNYSDESDEDDEVYGPILPEQEIKSKNHLALEERALEIKLKQLNPEEQKTQREEWMTELPTVSASKLGLGPRQFRPNAGPDMSDRSSWTDTPNTKKKKPIQAVNLKEEMQEKDLKKRDKEQERMARKHKKESESLLQLHIKKKKEERSTAPKERVPFNRETDLQVNKFDEAQKAAVLKKAQLLDDRFSQGKSKYL